MKESRFAKEQMRDTAGRDRGSVDEVARKSKASEQNIYKWRKHSGGLAPAGTYRAVRQE